MDLKLVFDLDRINDPFFKYLFGELGEILLCPSDVSEHKNSYGFQGEWFSVHIIYYRDSPFSQKGASSSSQKEANIGTFYIGLGILDRTVMFNIKVEFGIDPIKEEIYKFVPGTEFGKREQLQLIDTNLLAFPFYQFINLILLLNRDEIGEQDIKWKGFEIKFNFISGNTNRGRLELLNGVLFLNDEFIMEIRVWCPDHARELKTLSYEVIIKIYRDLFITSLTGNEFTYPYFMKDINLPPNDDHFRILRSGIGPICKSARK